MKLLENIRFDFDGEDTSYLTHSFHPFPAKFPPQLPKVILSEFSGKGEIVLDPFCGSGTTLVEAQLQGIDSVGVDINGLACLLSEVKSKPLSKQQQSLAAELFNRISDESFLWEMGKKKDVTVPKFDGLSHWFQPNVAKELAFLRNEILAIKDKAARDFLRVVLSSIIVRVSNQESDTRFAAIDKKIKDGFTFKLFLDRGKVFLEKMRAFSKQVKTPTIVEVYNTDSRDLGFLNSRKFDLIVTSPPYANTYDYYLYHKFRKRWLDIDVHYAQYNEIGSRREFSSLKNDPSKWVYDLKLCFMQISSVLKKKGLAFIIIGDSIIRKKLLRMDEVISEFAPSVGLEVCEIVSSDLKRHSKIFNPAFAQRGKKEHLMLLQKQ